MERTGTLIVGAGPTGLGAAWRLDQLGHRDRPLQHRQSVLRGPLQEQLPGDPGQAAGGQRRGDQALRGDQGSSRSIPAVGSLVSTRV